MAHPQWHVLPTAVVGGFSCVFYRPLKIWGKNTLVILLVIGFGLLTDIDHLCLRRVKKLLRGDISPVEGWINHMHTWYALVGVVVISVIIGNLLPLASYALHVLVDGANRANLEYLDSPLPRAIHGFYPRWLTYDSESKAN